MGVFIVSFGFPEQYAVAAEWTQARKYDQFAVPERRRRLWFLTGPFPGRWMRTRFFTLPETRDLEL
jgi:hypothetical protein